MINQQQLENALNAYVNNSQTLGQLITIANQRNFNTNDAKQAALMMGNVALAANSGDSVIVSNIGGAYESVLYVGLLESGCCPQANDTNYHNARVNDFRIIKERAQQQAQQQNTGGSMFGTPQQTQATGGMFDSAPAQNANDMFCQQETASAGMFDTPAPAPAEQPQANLTMNTTLDVSAQSTFQNFGAKTIMEELSKHMLPQLVQAAAPIRVINDDVQLFKNIQDNLDASDLDIGSSEIEISTNKDDSTVRCKLTHQTNTYHLNSKVDGVVEIIDLLNVEVNSMLSAAYAAKDSTDTNEQWSVLLKNLGGMVTMIGKAADEISEIEGVSRMYLVDLAMIRARLSAEIYSIFTSSIFYATGNGEFPDFDGTNTQPRLFVPDYSDLQTELEQFEDIFYANYNGHCADTFSQMFTYIAKMIGSIIFELDDERNLFLGTRELQVYVGMEMFTGEESTQTTPASKMVTPNVVRLLDNLLDTFEEKFSKYRLKVTDVTLKSKFVDRAYSSDNAYLSSIKM